MTKNEMDAYLTSIGGLNNGWFPDRPPICNSSFFSCNEGWYQIIHDLIEDLIKLGWDKSVLQVKEKFGGLRFYISQSTEKMDQRIAYAEQESTKTCEFCGTKENVTTATNPGEYWIRSLCNGCRKKE